MKYLTLQMLGDKKDYWRKYDALAARYIENFKLFYDRVPKDIIKAGPKRYEK
ncbi:MAG: hypothetical protein R2771_15025 [Saprospiraceae bacterium]